MSISNASRGSYRLLSDLNSEKNHEQRSLISFRVVVQILACLIFGVLGFVSGRFSRTASPDQNVATTFEYHEIYSQPPSPETNAAWLAEFPRAHGFVKPPNTEGLSVISVFHQLHCINVLRHGYYAALNSTYEEASLQDITISREGIKHDHIIHCFDYLRQASQCFSDQTIETVDLSRGGATGWGSEHQCRDHEKTIKLAQKWELHAKPNM